MLQKSACWNMQRIVSRIAIELANRQIPFCLPTPWCTSLAKGPFPLLAKIGVTANYKIVQEVVLISCKSSGRHKTVSPIIKKVGDCRLKIAFFNSVFL